MKKLCSILLLLIVLFNSLGYRLLTSLLEGQVNDRLETAFDNHQYEESELVSIKIPVSYLPYHHPSETFQRVDGQVEIQGVIYKYVKRRIYNDSLELLCIANPAVMKLNAVNNEYFRFLNDLQTEGHEKTSHSHHGNYKPFSIDQYTVADANHDSSFFLILPAPSDHFSMLTISGYKPSPDQPPEKVLI